MKNTGLILSLFLIYNSLPGSVNIDMALETGLRTHIGLLAIGEDHYTTENSAINPNKSDVYRVTFILRHNLIWVEAVVNGKEGLLLLDTGTDMLILNENHFRGEYTTGYVSGVIGDRNYTPRRLVTLQISNLPLHKLRAFIADLDHLEEHLQLEILGICGVDFLQQFQWVIHYHNRFIDFYPQDKSGDLMDIFSLPEPSEIIELQNATPLLYVQVQIGKYTLNLALDTGSSSTVFDEKYKNRLLAQNNQLEQSQQVSKVVGINGAREMITTFALYDINIGRTTVPPFQVNFMSLNRINRGIGFRLDGMFNPIFLCHGIIGINWKKKQLYVWKNLPKSQEPVMVRLDK